MVMINVQDVEAKLIALFDIFGILKELSEEQLKIFNECIKRRDDD